MPKSAAEATPPAGNRFVEFDEFIDYQLTKASRSIQSTDVLVGVVGAALGLTVYLFVFILADHWLVTGGLSATVRLLYWAIGFGALGYWVTTRVFRPLNGRVNALYAARQIEKSQPGLKSSLLVLTDLKQAGRSTAGPIRGSLEKRAAVGLSKADVDEAVDRRALMNSSYVLLFLLAVFCGYALFSPKSILQSAWRALMPFTHTGVATKTRIDHVDPGKAEVPALSHLDVLVEVSGQAPKEATLFYTTADRSFVDEAVPLRDTGEGLRRYKGTLIGTAGRGLQQSLNYYVTAGDARSDTYAVTVVQSPSAVVDSVGYEYQSYTGLANKEEPGGAIDAWEGTRVTVQATANQKVKSAMVLFSDTENTAVKAEELPMLVHEGTKLKASWQLAFRASDHSFPKFYRIQVTTEDNHQDPQPTLQPINVRPDLPPKAEILFPKSDIQAPVNGVVPITYRASDPDFKLRSLVLNLEHEQKILAVSPRLFDGPPDEESREGVYKLRLKDLNLKPGSRVTYWLEARDNFMTFGDRAANKTLSPRLNIDIVEPQKPEEQKKADKTAEKDAQQALKEPKPDQGQKGDGQQNPDQKPSDASSSKPSDDPMQEGEKQGNDPAGEKPNQDSKPEGEPSDNNPQGDRPQNQQPNNSPNQQGAKEQSGEKEDKDPQQQGDAGEGSSKQSQQGTEKQNPGEQGSKPEKGNESGNSSRNEQQRDGGQSGQRDRAPDDTALQKLIEWNKRKQEEERQKKSGASKPEDGQQQGSKEQQPGNKEPQRENKGQPGSEEKSQAGEKNSSKPMPGEKETGAEKETSPGKSPDDGKSPENKNPAGGDKGTESPGTESKPGESPKQGEKRDKESDSTKGGEKPATDDRAGNKSGEKPGDEAGKSGQKPEQPGATNEKPDAKQPGDNGPMPPTGEGADSKQENSSQEKSAQQKSEPSKKPGEENVKSPTQQEGAPGEKAPSNEAKDKQGATDANSKGQESPTGESGDRPMPGEQKEKSGEKAANSEKKPIGQNNKEGTREAGEGDPGSSTPSETGGQKTPGKGESGQNGEKSSSGEKGSNGNNSGSEKSGDGKQSSQSGSKSGGSEKGSGSQKSDSGQAGGKESGKAGNESQQGGGSKSPSGGDKQGQQQSGGEKQSLESKSGEKSSDNKAGGDKQAGEQKQGGDSKQGGGEQKQGGDEKQDGGGQKGGDGKSGDQGSSGQGSEGSGQGSSKSGSSQGGSKGGGGGSGSGSGSAPNDGASGKGSDQGTTPDPVNLENRKKATNLALKRLQDTLSRGEIDPELQKELGFTDDEMRSFMDRLQERLADNGDDNSAGAQARRRQFEQLLKGINLETKTTQRAGGEGTGPAAQGFGSSKKAAPREYKAAEKKYREALSGQKGK